jgi:hypothetical protein
MKDTPCLNCVNLQTTVNQYRCGAINVRLEDSVVLAQDIVGLPNCPFYIDKVTFVAYDPEAKIEGDLDDLVVVRRRRRKRRKHHRISIPERHLEMIEIIRDYYDRHHCWPSAKNIWWKSTMMSVPSVHNVLRHMAEQGLVIKESNTVQTQGRPTLWVYSLPSNLQLKNSIPYNGSVAAVG